MRSPSWVIPDSARVSRLSSSPFHAAQNAGQWNGLVGNAMAEVGETTARNAHPDGVLATFVKGDAVFATGAGAFTLVTTATGFAFTTASTTTDADTAAATTIGTENICLNSQFDSTQFLILLFGFELRQGIKGSFHHVDGVV